MQIIVFEIPSASDAFASKPVMNNRINSIFEHETNNVNNKNFTKMINQRNTEHYRAPQVSWLRVKIHNVRVHLMIGLNIFKILLVFPLIYILILWIKLPRFLFYDSNIVQDFTVVQSKNIDQELAVPPFCDIGHSLCVLQPWVWGWYPSPFVKMDRLIS